MSVSKARKQPFKKVSPGLSHSIQRLSRRLGEVSPLSAPFVPLRVLSSALCVPPISLSCGKTVTGVKALLITHKDNKPSNEIRVTLALSQGID